MLRTALQQRYRRGTWRYPWLYAAQQRAQVRVRRVRRRVHEPEFAALPSLRLPAAPLCLDVGANRGQSVISLKRVLPDARVESFEPNPVIFEDLLRTVRHYRDVRAHRLGLTDVARTAPLFIPESRGVRFEQLARFVPRTPGRRHSWHLSVTKG